MPTYWRSDANASRELWTAILERLQRSLEYKYASELERKRAVLGIALAERVLAEDGAPLADPKAARMVP